MLCLFKRKAINPLPRENKKKNNEQVILIHITPGHIVYDLLREY